MVKQRVRAGCVGGERTRRFVRPVLFCAVAAVLLVNAACDEEGPPHPGQSRLLDEICATKDACTTRSPNAQQTTGPTADSVGFRIRGGEGSVTLRIPAQPLHGTDNTWHLEVLVAGHGRFTTSEDRTDSALHPIPTTYDWVKLPDHVEWGDTPRGDAGEGLDGGILSGAPSSTTPVTIAPFTFTVSLSDGSSNVDIADVRLSSSYTALGGCAVAHSAVGRR
ncbi:MAG: hypothetical protein NVSMB1_05310 [Polyangiales bacterium]